MVLIVLVSVFGGKDILVPWAKEGPLWDEALYDSFRGGSEFPGAAHGRSPCCSPDAQCHMVRQCVWDPVTSKRQAWTRTEAVPWLFSRSAEV